jgi:hypothetical protein
MKSTRLWFLIRAFFHGFTHPFDTEQDRELYALKLMREWKAADETHAE